MAAPESSPRDQAAGEMAEAFRSAHRAVSSYLDGGGGVTTADAAEVATIHLLSRGLADVAVAQRIVGEHYPIQAYSVLRAAWEAARLIELFQQERQLADDWVAGNHRMFSPAQVRRRLGEHEDHVYSYMCARSHPGFAGLQMSMFDVADAPDGLAIHFTSIPFEVPDAFTAVAWPGRVLAQLAVLSGHVKFTDSEHRRGHLAPMLRESSAELLKGWLAMAAALAEDDRGDACTHDLGEFVAWFREHLTVVSQSIDQIHGD